MKSRSVLECASVVALFVAAPAHAALVWQDGPGHRSAPVTLNPGASVGFTRMLPLDTGVLFTNYLAQARHLTNQILLNGSGIAAGDVDNDGWCDLYFCALDGDNKLYRNLGNWRFEDVTAHAGVGCPGIDATGAAFADLNADGHLDLLVNTIGQGTRLFTNSGLGAFISAPTLNSNRAGMTFAIADVDGDGDLDVYVANYRVVTLRDQPNTRFTIGRVNGQPVVKAVNGQPLTDPGLTNRFSFRIQFNDGRPSLATDENGEPDVLYRNDGSGRFTASASRETFLDEHGKPMADLQLDWGLSAMFRDMNGDLAPDLYVCNDFKSPDRVWLNDGGGRFRAVGALALRQSSLSSMGVDFADINRDGHDDFIVLDMLSPRHDRRFMQRIDIQPEMSPVGVISNRMQTPRNVLLLNRGDGTYAEVAQLAGVEATEWSWTPIFLDVDLDGFEDLLVSSGFERDGMNVDVLSRMEQAKQEAKLSSIAQLHLRKLFPRLATGTFALRNNGNLSFSDMSRQWRFTESSVSQGMAVADLDNDGDMDVIANNMNSGASLYRNDCTAPRIAVRLNGLKPNEAGIGARIKVSGGPVAQEQEIISGGRYLSSDQPTRSFAAGHNMTIEVAWRSGKVTTVRGVASNRIYEIHEEAAVLLARAKPSEPKSLFVEAPVSHSHHQEELDDFARQPLLPNRLSRRGPGIAWFDLNGDGWEDLLFSSAEESESSAIYNGEGRLDGSGITVKAPPLVAGSSTSPVALADYNRDGHLDRFIGGRIVPSGYPQSEASLLFLGSPKGFSLDENLSKALTNVGLVSGAVFTDLIGDDSPELVFACEWGPIRVFEIKPGSLREITGKLGLERFRGWWTSVTTGDLNSDGRLDIVAGNFGRNSKYERFRSQPLRLYYGDINGDEVIEPLESVFDPVLKQWAPFQPYHVITAALPSIRERYPTAQSYANAAFDEIYRPVRETLTLLEANWLETTVFLNLGERFEARVLPVEAQFAPVFGICVLDFDNDSKEDLFLNQNFFATNPETSRYDAGRGLLLRGIGDGSFVPLSGQESGIAIYGEGRGAAVCDYDHDGRPDMAVAQNGAATKLFRNVGAPEGLRVSLLGPPGNPKAIGAIFRAGFANSTTGPARELKAGAGYWSQDAATQVLPASTKQLHVRWPGGAKTTSDIPAGAKAIKIAVNGSLVGAVR